MIKLVGQVFNANFTVSYKCVITFVQKKYSLTSSRSLLCVLLFALVSITTVKEPCAHVMVGYVFGQFDEEHALTVTGYYHF